MRDDGNGIENENEDEDEDESLVLYRWIERGVEISLGREPPLL